MKLYRSIVLLLSIVISISSCNKDDDEDFPQPEASEESIYFPPINTNEWQTISPNELNWNLNKLENLKQFLIAESTKSFMVLVNGKIVVEEYFNGHDTTETWQWNSAGKTLVTAITGIAQQNGLLDINQKVSNYLGNNWTSMPIEKENLITSQNLLTMTSGINDQTNLVAPATMTYLADAGTRWSYHNVFQKLIDVVSQSSNQDYHTYFNQQLESKIGMQGFWNFGLIFKIYHSDTRSMARFGLLALNKGKWEENQIVDADYFNSSINTSQNLNPSYGYMWWLNGKSSFMLPGGQDVYQNILVPNAPNDMYAAMGKDEQRIYVVPSKDMVVIRMGEGSTLGSSAFAVSGFDNVFWGKLNDVIN